MLDLEKQELHVIFGASGGIGNAIVRQLVNQGKQVRAINRSGDAIVPNGVECMAADLLDLDEALKVSNGATHIYNAVNVHYTKWVKEFPKFTAAFIDLIEKTGVNGIVTDNLYMYGENVREPLREDMPYLAKGPKGKIRGEVANMYHKACNEKRINLLIVRAPDFYGPGVTSSSFYGDRFFANILQNKSVQLLGKLDQPHAIIYVEDFANAIITLALNEDAYGQIWHAPFDKPLTQQEFADLAYNLAKTQGKIKTIPKFLIRSLSWFVPIMKEIKEMLYEFDNPYLVDTSKYEDQFKTDITPHKVAITETLQWYKTNYMKTK